METLAMQNAQYQPTFMLNDILSTVSIKPRAKKKPSRLKPLRGSEGNRASEDKALLQKGHVLNQTGNHEMALVYFHRGTKHYPKAEEFKEAISRTEKQSQRKGRRMKMTTTGDISIFTKSHKSPPLKQFQWKNKPKEKVDRAMLPSANFRARQVHPLVKIERTPSIHLSESRASKNSFLAGSLESLAYQDRLVEESSEKDTLGELYTDKEYFEFLLGAETLKKSKTPLGKGSVAETAENGLSFLEERRQFWDSLGPLPPPHPSRTSKLARGKLSRDRSRLSQYTSTDSLNTVESFNSGSSIRSTDASTRSRSTGKRPYRSVYSFGRKKDKPAPPNPEKVRFEFASYMRDSELREMTQILEEEVDPHKASEDEAEKKREEARKRGEDISGFIQKEIKDIDRYYSKGQLDLCKKRADACIDVLGRYTEEEVPIKHILLSTLYSCLGNCDMQTKSYNSALENHGHDLLIGEQYENLEIQSRALGNIGRVNVLMGKYNRALDMYNRKAPLCKTHEETAWLFHEIGNCFLMMKIFEYAHESGLKALKAANEAGERRLQLQTNILVGVAEVNLVKYKEAYQHFETALDLAKILDDRRVQDAMTKALVDVNKKMVQQMKSKKASKEFKRSSPVPFKVTSVTPVSRATPMSAKTDVTVEG